MSTRTRQGLPSSHCSANLRPLTSQRNSLKAFESVHTMNTLHSDGWTSSPISGELHEIQSVRERKTKNEIPGAPRRVRMNLRRTTARLFGRPLCSQCRSELTIVSIVCRVLPVIGPIDSFDLVRRISKHLNRTFQAMERPELS